MTKKAVSSKIKITARSSSLKEYRRSIKEVTEKMYKTVRPMAEDLLTLKICLMGCVRKVEEEIRERRLQ